MMAKIVLATLLLFTALYNVSSLFRITKVHCESHNKSAVVVNNCRLRAISRHVTKAYINVTVLHAAFKIDLDAVMMKRANGYKPFVMSFKIDACEFYVKRNNPIANLIFGIFKDFSTVNHTCPYVGLQYVDGLYLKHELLNQLPMPDGEYAFMMTWIFEKRKAFSTDVYFEFKNI